MAGVSIAETGLRYAWETLKVYWGAGMPFFVYFAAGLIWTAVDKKQKEARVFWYYTIVLGLTVYNPLLVRYLVPRWIESTVYYRFFWVLPVTIAVAYDMTLLISKCGRRWLKLCAAAVLLVLIGTTASVNETVLDHLQPPSNIYKVPDEVVQACALIHEDYKGEGEPKAVFTFDLEVYVRQYDASIRLSIDRETRLYYNGSQTVGNPENSKTYKRKKRILDVINSAEEVPIKQFQRAMHQTRTRYLVIPAEYACHDYLKEAGCEAFGEAGGYIVYRYDPE
ncbi:MAG: hypothetical protein Q4E91_00805 [Lachnospiraceae bacterium]|nr:hypothetical protein [Lachnospiraceae bacterium]